MKVQDLRDRVNVEETRVDGSEVAAGGEAAAEGGCELLAAGERDATSIKPRKQRLR